MILTTNRISSIDPAFESRIDISLAYRNLDQDARAQVWRGFIQSIAEESVQIEKRDIEILAEAELNGRQIKSAIKTACILAQTVGSKLGLGHLQMVLKVRERASKLIGNGHC
jgi:ATP-dependent 26S proteasome regulatory subunit